MVSEVAIDLISYVEICGDYVTNNLALGMLSDAPLVTFLVKQPKVSKTSFCLDNNEAGQESGGGARGKILWSGL